jgi:hypothetical protein
MLCNVIRRVPDGYYGGLFPIVTILSHFVPVAKLNGLLVAYEIPGLRLIFLDGAVAVRGGG